MIIAPVFERNETGYYNSAAVIDADGSLLETYRKIHIPHDPLFYEQSYFSPGQEYRVYDTRYARFAVLICYDQWFPEAARAVALQGAEIIFYPTAIGWIKDVEPEEGNWLDAWETMQRAHAIANSVCVAAVNRVGQEGDLLFWGNSFVCDSFGQILARAGERGGGLGGRAGPGQERQRARGLGILPQPPAGYLLASDRDAAGERLKPAPKGPCLQDTPRSLGYHMPGEWERHDAVWLSWPYDLDSFPEIELVEKAYVSMIKALHEGETVNLLVKDEPMLDRVVGLLREAAVDLRKVRFHLVSYADVWFRDYGPTFVVNRDEKKLAMVTWTFNAWGEKYPELMGDTRIPCLINDDLKLECFMPGIVLEGGSIEVNGLGTVLTTEQCLLNKNRNPSLGKEEIEAYLKEYLGVSKIIWLKQGIAGDDTDGHVDDIARFVNPTTVLCAYEDDPEDENYLALKENYELLCTGDGPGRKSAAGDQAAHARARGEERCGCPPATPTSTSETRWSWCRSSGTRTTRRR